jgi:hypothetical protein
MYLGTGTVLSGNKLVRQKEVLDWIYVGTIQKIICAPARQLEYSLSEKCCFRLFWQRV